MPFEQPILRFGDSNEAVVELQVDLTEIGCLVGAVDGVFGQQTQDGVQEVQSAFGLSVDGVVGPATWAVLQGPVATVEQSIDLVDFPSIARVRETALAGADVEAYIADIRADEDGVG